MTPKISSFLFLLFIFSQIFHANSSQYSMFESIKNLQGSRKGDETKGLNQIKNYLKKFGYIEGDINPANSDYFDDVLESAIKTYQSFFHLNSSGVLDIETLAQMAKPRCGMPDIVNHHNHDHDHNHSHESTLGDLKYAFLPGKPKWTPTNKQLIFAYSRTVPAPHSVPIGEAFDPWSKHINIKFIQSNNFDGANIRIELKPIDGQFGMTAGAEPPMIGYILFDSAEKWFYSIVGRPTKDEIDLFSVALHEIGHALGLDHTNVKNAVMFPTFDYGETKRELTADDIAGITELYRDG